MTASPPIRVLLVDDHTMVRRGLALFLKAFDDLLLAGEAASGEAAIPLYGRLRPHRVLIDLVMPGDDGVGSAGPTRGDSSPVEPRTAPRQIVPTPGSGIDPGAGATYHTHGTPRVAVSVALNGVARLPRGKHRGAGACPGWRCPRRRS